MKLVNAVSKIAELPKILTQHGIPMEDVLGVQYNKNAIGNTDILVQLHLKESIEKLGNCEIENFIANDDTNWTYYNTINGGISFVYCEREAIA